MNENNTSSVKVQKNDKKKRRFNFIDLLLILIVVVLVASVIYVFVPRNFIKGIFTDKTVDIEYSIEITGVDKEFIENIKENDIILDGVSKANIGTVKAVNVQEQTVLKYVDGSNQGTLVPVEDKYDLIVTITAKADFNEGEGYSINGTRIAVGEKINAVFPNYIGQGYCISVPVSND